MPVTERTYELVAMEDPEGSWELDHGRLRSKPSGCVEHGDVTTYLGILVADGLDRKRFRTRINAGRVRCSRVRYEVTCYVPDVCVIPMALTLPLRGQPDRLELYDEPLPLEVEVWDLPTDGYDSDAKLPAYRQHGEGEIWRVHPFERTLTAWRRRPDGSYDEQTYRGGIVRPATLPGVAVDLATLFD